MSFRNDILLSLRLNDLKRKIKAGELTRDIPCKECILKKTCQKKTNQNRIGCPTGVRKKKT